MRSCGGIPCRERRLGRKSRPPLSRGGVWAQMLPRRKGVAQTAREGALPLAIWVLPKHRAEEMIFLNQEVLKAVPSDSKLCFSIAVWLNKRTKLKILNAFTHDCSSACKHWSTWALSVLGSPFIYIHLSASVHVGKQHAEHGKGCPKGKVALSFPAVGIVVPNTESENQRMFWVGRDQPQGSSSLTSGPSKNNHKIHPKIHTMCLVLENDSFPTQTAHSQSSGRRKCFVNAKYFITVERETRSSHKKETQHHFHR